MKFYVYELVDPRDCSVFYIGKGQRNRVHAHEAEARKGVYNQKCERIRQIWAASEKVERRVVSRHADENEALQAEFDLIANYGLANLTNVMPGGVMGAEVYMARLAEAEARKKVRDKEVLAKKFIEVAPQIAMVLRAKATGGQVGAWVGGRWLDFTEAFYSLLQSMFKLLGVEFVAGALAPYNVEVKEA